MKKSKNNNKFFTTAFIFLAVIVIFSFAPKIIGGNFKNWLASTFFVESSRPEDLKDGFKEASKGNGKIRILIVPGHDNEFWGTEFLGVREADINLAIGKELARLFSLDKEFEIILARGDYGYNPILDNYFIVNREDILSFVGEKKRIMTNLKSSAMVSEKIDGVYHNNAKDSVLIKLYGINKWANENNIDVVISIHVNDYPRRNLSNAGKYSGFSIYVPEKQYSNSRASKEIAKSIAKEIGSFYFQSNLPKEDVGIVEDQDLVAIGAFNTLDPASVLIEYGYIYEPQFLDEEIRNKTIKEFALKTYSGLHAFFESGKDVIGKYGTTFLPSKWNSNLNKGIRNNHEVLSLQVALTLEGLYPPEGNSKRDCPISGNFGNCTEIAVKSFQKKYGINENGEVGEITAQKLNEKYSE